MSLGQFMPMAWLDSGRTPDPFWNNVVAALHMDALDGSGLPIDVSPLAKTYTRGGVPVVDSSEKLLGEASYLFSGTGQYFYSANQAAFNLSTGSLFSVELWFRTPMNGSIWQWLVTHKPTASWSEPAVVINPTGSGGKYRIILNANNADRVTSGFIIEPNRWHHLSYGRAAGNRWYLYIDGILIGTYIFSGAGGEMHFALGAAGWQRNTSNTDKFKGNLDEFRWWNGVSIRDGINNFTPPTAPWADS